MKMKWTILPPLVLLSACAHDGGTKSIAGDPKRGVEYTSTVTPTTARLLGPQRVACPKQSVALKGRPWRFQVQALTSCANDGRWVVVENLAEQMAQTDHLAPWGAYFLSLAAEQRKDYPRATWMIELALKKAPGSGLLVYQRARLKWLSKDQPRAAEDFKHALALDNRLTDAHVVLGQMALNENRLDEAASRFQAAIGLEPNHLIAWMGLAEVKLLRKDYKGATAALSSVISDHPSCARARLKLAHITETFEKNIPEALSAYKTIRSLARDRKLDAAVDMDLEGKIRELESQVQDGSQRLSLREPGGKKVKK